MGLLHNIDLKWYQPSDPSHFLIDFNNHKALAGMN